MNLLTRWSAVVVFVLTISSVWASEEVCAPATTLIPGSWDHQEVTKEKGPSLWYLEQKTRNCGQGAESHCTPWSDPERRVEIVVADQQTGQAYRYGLSETSDGRDSHLEVSAVEQGGLFEWFRHFVVARRVLHPQGSPVPPVPGMHLRIGYWGDELIHDRLIDSIGEGGGIQPQYLMSIWKMNPDERVALWISSDFKTACLRY